MMSLIVSLLIGFRTDILGSEPPCLAAALASGTCFSPSSLFTLFTKVNVPTHVT